MPVFRKKKCPIRILASSEVLEYRPKFVDEEVDGVISSRLVYQIVNVLDPEGIAAIPDKEDYTLNNILKSGVPIQEVNCGSILNPSDPADVEEAAVTAALNVVATPAEPSFVDPSIKEPILSQMSPEPTPEPNN